MKIRLPFLDTRGVYVKIARDDSKVSSLSSKFNRIPRSEYGSLVVGLLLRKTDELKEFLV